MQSADPVAAAVFAALKAAPAAPPPATATTSEAVVILAAGLKAGMSAMIVAGPIVRVSALKAATAAPPPAAATPAALPIALLVVASLPVSAAARPVQFMGRDTAEVESRKPGRSYETVTLHASVHTDTGTQCESSRGVIMLAQSQLGI